MGNTYNEVFIRRMFRNVRLFDIKVSLRKAGVYTIKKDKASCLIENYQEMPVVSSPVEYRYNNSEGRDVNGKGYY